MSPEQENFDGLRRLMALKRHEQPPPGYFDHFSRQVLVRIRTGERGEETGAFGTMFSEAPWLQRILSTLTTNPTFAGAFGLVVCSLLVAGVAYSNNSGGGAPQQTIQELTSESSLGLQLANQSSGFVSSTNGYMPDQPPPSLFDEFRNRQAQPTPTLVNALSH